MSSGISRWISIVAASLVLAGASAPATAQPATPPSSPPPAAAAAPAGAQAAGPPAPAFAMGLEFADPAQYLALPPAPPVLGSGQLPSSVKMDADFPPPGDQGQQSSCVGWAVAYALSSYQENKRLDWGLQSSEHLFSPAYIYNQIHGPMPGCQQGSSFMDALRLLTQKGVASLADFPYSPMACSTQPTPAIDAAALQHRAGNWRRVNVQDPVEVKTQLAAGYPILIAMRVDAAFQALRGNAVYTGAMGPILGGHAMTLTGYDDSLGAFRVINSWGTGWGDHGFGWIGYTAFTQLVAEGYLVLPGASPTPAPAPAPPGPTPAPAPAPAPGPVPSPPAVPIAQVSALQVTPIVTPQFVGLGINAAGSIKDAAGQTTQVVYAFYVFHPSMGWVPINAVPGSPFANAGGQLATGTAPFTPPTASFDLAQLGTISIPLAAFPLGPPRGLVYRVAVEAQVWVNWNRLPMSQRTEFPLSW